MSSAARFAAVGLHQLAVTALAPEAQLIPLVAGNSLAFLVLLGAVAARVIGARALLGGLA